MPNEPVDWFLPRVPRLTDTRLTDLDFANDIALMSQSRKPVDSLSK